MRDDTRATKQEKIMLDFGTLDPRFGYCNCWARTQRLNNGSYGTVVYCSGWDKDGNDVIERSVVRPHLYYEADKNTEHLATAVSMYGRPLIKKEFSTQSQRNEWCNSHPSVPTYENLPVVRQYLLNRFHGCERNDEFMSKKFDVWTIDIENAVGEGNPFPEPLEAKYPVNLITMHNSRDGMYHIWYMPSRSDEEIVKPYIEEGLNDKEEIDMNKRDYRRFNSETKLLADFFYFWSENVRGYNSLVTGWNVSTFDLPYLYNRGKKVLGEVFDVDGCLSPSGNCYFQDDDNVMTKILKISGVIIFDYMYADKFKFEKGKQSYALDRILDDELGISKLDHSEYKGFFEFYTNNFSKYAEYNIFDVERVTRLDKKKHFIDLARKICGLGLVEFESIYHTLPYVQGALVAQARYDNKIFMSTSGKPEPEGGFRGAYVHDTRTGFYSKGGYTFDLNSLYPNVMNTINCSPETKVGIFRDDPNDKSCVIFTPYTNDKEMKLSKEKLSSLLDTKFCVSANNVLYLKPEIQKGIMPKFLEWLYAERRATKNKGLQCDVKINELRVQGITSGPEVESLQTSSTLYSNTQQAYKIMLNSVYGIIGLRHYCCYDKDSAEAVTQTGQAVIKKSLDITMDLHREMLGYEGPHPTLAGDTDSTMNNGEPIYRKLWGDRKIEWTKDEVSQFKSEAKKICDELNSRILSWVHDAFHTSVSRIEFKLETVFSHACFLKPKHYCYRMVDKEGSYMVGSPKSMKMTGIDLKRNQIPKPIQKVLKYAVENGMLEEWPDSKFREYMSAEIRKMKDSPIEQFSFQFAYKTECESVGFLQMAPRATVAAKAATYYNQLIEHLGLTSQKKIHLGDNVHYVYVKPDNQYGIEVVGFNEGWPEEFGKIFEIDYRSMVEKLIFSKIKDFMVLFGWHHFDPFDESEVDIFSL